MIDGVFVNGSARAGRLVRAVIRHLQSGYIYHYAFTMIIGVLVLLTLLFIAAEHRMITITMLPILLARDLGADRRRPRRARHRLRPQRAGRAR